MKGRIQSRRLIGRLCLVLLCAVSLGCGLASASKGVEGEAPGISTPSEAGAPMAEGNDEAMFRRANELYRQGRYEDAAVIYSSLARKLGNPRLYYNLGNCWFRLYLQGKKRKDGLGYLGLAVWAWRMAALRDPRDEETRKNLEIAGRYLADKLPEEKLSLVERLVEEARRIRPTTIQGAFLVVLWCCALLFLVYRHGRLGFSASELVFWLLVGLVPLALIFGGWTWLVTRAVEHPSEAVVVASQVHARSVPAPSGGSEVFTLHEGVVVRVGRESGRWIQVVLPGGAAGWVESRFLRLVE